MEQNTQNIRVSNDGLSFDDALRTSGLGLLTRAPLSELQVNVGRLCNQACSHCHVDAGPKRKEIMSWETMTRILSWFEKARLPRVDITGGAPELNPQFRRFVDGFMARGAHVTSRCNLTVLFEPDQEDLAGWYARRRIRLVCSLPCYSKQNVDEQRGRGVFNKSIEALHRLNQHGYGLEEGLVVDLVYNPGGAMLPPAQGQLEADYKTRLFDGFGIRFNRLLTLTNLPINRFAHYLRRTCQTQSYQQLLVDNFNLHSIPNLMCRHLLSVDWLGRAYDCDFNQMLALPLGDGDPSHLWELDPHALKDAPIAVDRHCFGCTAGAGSSCGGALVSNGTV
jgi:radical SAM/Cys-rich protein